MIKFKLYKKILILHGIDQDNYKVLIEIPGACGLFMLWGNRIILSIILSPMN